MVPPKLKVGPQNWICLLKNISSFQYMKGKLLDPLYTHFANISCSSHWYLAIICHPASMLESQNSSAQEWYVIPLIYIHPRHSWYIYIALKSLYSTRLVLSIPKFMWSSPIISATKLAWGIDALTRVAWLCPVILRFDFLFPIFLRWHMEQVPHQLNAYDCALYLLHFTEMFMSRPTDFQKLVKVSPWLYCLCIWVNQCAFCFLDRWPKIATPLAAPSHSRQMQVTAKADSFIVAVHTVLRYISTHTVIISLCTQNMSLTPQRPGQPCKVKYYYTRTFGTIYSKTDSTVHKICWISGMECWGLKFESVSGQKIISHSVRLVLVIHSFNMLNSYTIIYHPDEQLHAI